MNPNVYIHCFIMVINHATMLTFDLNKKISYEGLIFWGGREQKVIWSLVYINNNEKLVSKILYPVDLHDYLSSYEISTVSTLTLV